MTVRQPEPKPKSGRQLLPGNRTSRRSLSFDRVIDTGSPMGTEAADRCLADDSGKLSYVSIVGPSGFAASQTLLRSPQACFPTRTGLRSRFRTSDQSRYT